MTLVEDNDETDCLGRAGLPRDTIAPWGAGDDAVTGDYRRDAEDFSRQWRIGAEMIAFLPPKPSRSEAQSVAAAAIKQRDRASREKFLAVHIETIYRRLTGDFAHFKRVEQLLADAAVLSPGLVPDDAQLRRDSGLAQRDKDGAEIDQGLFLSHLMA